MKPSQGKGIKDQDGMQMAQQRGGCRSQEDVGPSSPIVIVAPKIKFENFQVTNPRVITSNRQNQKIRLVEPSTYAREHFLLSLSNFRAGEYSPSSRISQRLYQDFVLKFIELVFFSERCYRFIYYVGFSLLCIKNIDFQMLTFNRCLMISGICCEVHILIQILMLQETE